MKCLVTALTCAAALCFAGQAANAADMPVKAPAYAPAFNWTGFYAGADAGYVWVNAKAEVPALATGQGTSHPDSGTFGGHIGYLYEFSNRVVVGIEGDMSWLDGNSFGVFPLGAGFGANTKWDASLRGVLGYALDMNLIYLTGGASWINGSGCATAGTPVCIAGTNYTDTLNGWTIGGGYAHAFTPNVIGRVEYLYAGYSTDSIATVGGTTNVGGNTSKLRVGLSWKF